MRRETDTYQYKKRPGISSLPNMIVTLLLCITCWYIGYDYWIGFPIRTGNDASLVWQYICGFCTEKNYAYIAGFSLLLFAAALLQRLNFFFVIVKRKTTLPFLIFLLLNSVNPDIYPIRPLSIVLFLLILAIFELFRSFQNPDQTGRMFNIMVYLGAGSLIWPYLVWFIPVFLIGMYRFRILNTHTCLTSLLGIFTVCWFVLGWCVWKHDWAIVSNFVQCIAAIQPFFVKGTGFYEYLTPLCICLLTVVLTVHASLQETDNTIRTHYFLSFLLMLGLVAFILSLVYASGAADFICVFYFAVTIPAAQMLSGKYGIVSLALYYLFIFLLFILFFVRLWSFL